VGNLQAACRAYLNSELRYTTLHHRLSDLLGENAHLLLVFQVEEAARDKARDDLQCLASQEGASQEAVERLSQAILPAARERAIETLGRDHGQEFVQEALDGWEPDLQGIGK